MLSFALEMKFHKAWNCWSTGEVSPFNFITNCQALSQSEQLQRLGHQQQRACATAPPVPSSSGHFQPFNFTH